MAAVNTIVRTNITAVNAHRQLSGAGIKQTSASQRLSSGKRINSAADDVAGLGIAEKMRAQIRSIDQASLNAQDGVSLIQTAEGALSSIGDMLIRTRELLIQAANDTNVHDPSMLDQSDRARIQTEIEHIMFEINSVAYRTEFNTRALLDGSLSVEGAIRGGDWHSVETITMNSAAQLQTLDEFLRTTANDPFLGSFEQLLHVIGADISDLNASDWLAMHVASNFAGLENALDYAMGVEFDANGDPVPGTGRWGEQLENRASLQFGNANELLNAFVQGLTNPNVFRPGDMGTNMPQSPFTSWQDFVDNADGNVGASTFSRALSESGGEPLYRALIRAEFHDLDQFSTFNDVRNIFYRMGGGWTTGLPDDIAAALNQTDVGNPRSWLQLRMGDDGASGLTDTDLWDAFSRRYIFADVTLEDRQIWRANEHERERGRPLWFHIGANSGQGIHMGINAMNTRALGDPFDLSELIDVERVDGRPISEQVEYIDHALMRANRERAHLGAVNNRLEFTMQNLDVASENLNAAMSRIRDADMAKEMMRFHQANIMTQAAVAMVAQANQSPQAVLELLQA